MTAFIGLGDQNNPIDRIKLNLQVALATITMIKIYSPLVSSGVY